MIHKKIDLWNKNEYSGADKLFMPKLVTYIIKGNEPKGSILILPGGGYGSTSWREAEPIAFWANAAGYNAFVLYYSVAPNRHPQPLLDATRAMCIIRDNAADWGVIADKIAVCGFSAGGHLAASLGVFHSRRYLQSVRGMSPEKNKPNAMVLCYPVISGVTDPHTGSFANLLGANASVERLKEVSPELHITKNTPPAFIWTTFNDAAVPAKNSLLLANAMNKKAVPFELHIFADGVHGLSLCNKQTYCGKEQFINPQAEMWKTLCINWLEKTL